MTKNELREELTKYFEANMLDGDPINDCGGAKVDAKEVMDFILSPSTLELLKECYKPQVSSGPAPMEVVVKEGEHVND